jgi:ribosomal protein L25 (general stress protein Ctc)
MRMREKQPRGHSPGPGLLSTPRRPYKSYHAPGTIFKTYQGPNERSPQDNKFDFDATLNPVHVVDPINWYGGKADNFAASVTNNNPLKNKIVHTDIRAQTVDFDNGYEPKKAKTRSANNNPLKDKVVHADIRVEGIDDYDELMWMKPKQKVKMSKTPIIRRTLVQAKAPVQGKTPIENGTGKSAASTFTNKVEKHRKSIPMFKVLSHVTSFHALSMSSRSVSYTISEDCTKYSTRHRLRALEGGDRRALVKPSKQSHT